MRQFIIDRLEEPTTWQVIVFFAIMPVCHYGYDTQWGLASSIGYAVSAVAKAVMPDNFRVLSRAREWICSKL